MARRRRIASMREKVKKNAETTGGTSLLNLPEGADFFKEKRGRFLIDILPYEVTKPGHPDDVEPGEWWYKRPFWVHFGIGTAERAYVCPKSVGQKCPICEYREQLVKDGYEENKSLIDDLRPRLRVLYNVRILNNSNYDEDKVYLWQVAHANFQKQLNIEIQEGEEDYADFPHPEYGYHLRVRFVEESFSGRKFLVADRIDFVERDEPIPDDLLDQVYPLDDLLKILPYDKLKAIFWEGEEDVPESIEDTSVRETSRRREDEEEEERRPRRLGRRREEDEEEAGKKRREEEEEEEKPRRRRRAREEEEEEEEEKPRRPRRRQVEDEEEEPRKKEESEEEEEKPRRRGRRKKEEEEEDIPVESGKEEEEEIEECPYGHEFGTDWDETDDCPACEVWDSCRLAANKRRKK